MIPKGDVVPELSAAVADLVVDCTGLACPLPVVKTAQAIKNLALGQVLELLATDPGVEPDMRAWSSRTGNDLLGIDKQADVFRILIRRVK
ncbi:MAG: sulfurtransferase TusA family protein [Acidimicrobiales bacterium]